MGIGRLSAVALIGWGLTVATALPISARGQAQSDAAGGLQASGLPMVDLALGSRPSRRVTIQPGLVFRDCTNCPEMVVLPTGTFPMGSPLGEEAREQVNVRHRGRAAPSREVRIGYLLAVGRTEVTVGQFARFVAATGRRMDGCWDFIDRRWRFLPDRTWRRPGFPQSDRDPVVCVSWDDAKAFVTWISEQMGLPYRLLSEAEWEFAARSGIGSARYWGDELGRGNANCNGCGSRWDDLRTAPVRSFAENRYYLFDMLGNVAEWVEDCWHDDYVAAPADGSAWISGQCEFRVIRGGSWRSQPAAVRAAARARDLPNLRANSIGFRIARDMMQ